MVSSVPSRSAPVARIVAAARAARVRLVRFLYTDNGGVTRGKATHVESLAQRMADGIGLTVAMQAMNMLDHLTPVEGMGPVGEIRLVPDPATFAVLPYAPHSAAMTTDMLALDGTPWGACRARSSSARSLPARRRDSASRRRSSASSAWPRGRPTEATGLSMRASASRRWG